MLFARFTAQGLGLREDKDSGSGSFIHLLETLNFYFKLFPSSKESYYLGSTSATLDCLNLIYGVCLRIWDLGRVGLRVQVVLKSCRN